MYIQSYNTVTSVYISGEMAKTRRQRKHKFASGEKATDSV